MVRQGWEAFGGSGLSSASTGQNRQHNCFLPTSPGASHPAGDSHSAPEKAYINHAVSSSSLPPQRLRLTIPAALPVTPSPHPRGEPRTRSSGLALLLLRVVVVVVVSSALTLTLNPRTRSSGLALLLLLRVVLVLVVSSVSRCERAAAPSVAGAAAPSYSDGKNMRIATLGFGTA